MKPRVTFRVLLALFVAVGLFVGGKGWMSGDRSTLLVSTNPSESETRGLVTKSQDPSAPAPKTRSKPGTRVSQDPAREKDLREAARKVTILTEILDSKNDNDPRLDREFNQLTPTSKTALSQKYEALPAEARNEKGTVVFLLGRSLSNETDLSFMKQVLNEPTCLSLDDCSKPDRNPATDPDFSNGVNITLDYPKITALKSLENYIQRNPESALTPQASDLVRQAIQTGSPTVRRMASAILTKVQKKS